MFFLIHVKKIFLPCSMSACVLCVSVSQWFHVLKKQKINSNWNYNCLFIQQLINNLFLFEVNYYSIEVNGAMHLFITY